MPRMLAAIAAYVNDNAEEKRNDRKKGGGEDLKFASSNIESSFLLCCARYHVKKFSSSFHRHSPSFDPKVGAAGILPIKGTIEA